MQSCAQETEVNQKHSPSTSQTEESLITSIISPEGTSIKTRFNPPAGYERVNLDSNSYSSYLQNLPLKKHGAIVLHYDGSQKFSVGVYEAVVDLEIGKKNLHQCADAIMRLRAEYLWNQKRYNEIHFNFTNGFRVDNST